MSILVSPPSMQQPSLNKLRGLSLAAPKSSISPLRLSDVKVIAAQGCTIELRM